MASDLLIYGAGGAGRELASELENSDWNVIGFVDDVVKESVINDISVLGGEEWLAATGGSVAVTLAGDPQHRREVIQRLKTYGTLEFPTILSRNSILSDFIQWGEGCIVALPFNHITVNVLMGDFVWINSYNGIGHDTHIGSYTTVFSSINIGGGTNIGENCLIGSGSVINPGTTIGDNVIVGAGSVVVKDVPDNVVIAGVPARLIKER